MARTHKPKSVVFNNYITLRLLGRSLIGVSQGLTAVDSLVMPARFRVSQVCFDALGLTANVTGQALATSDLGEKDLDAAAPVIITPGGMDSQAARTLSKGNTLSYRIATDASGVHPAGASACWVTGYFTEPISRSSPHAESGQQSGEAPVAGYYDIWPLINLRASANQVERVECQFIVPYPARIMAIQYDLRGHTETTGAILAGIRNNSVAVHTMLDVDVNEQFVVDNNSSPAFASSAVRDVTKGQIVDLRIQTGVSDVVPIGTLTANILVWVKGHVRDENALPTTED